MKTLKEQLTTAYHELATRYFNNQKIVVRGIPVTFKVVNDVTVQIFHGGKAEISSQDADLIKDIMSKTVKCFIFTFFTSENSDNHAKALYFRFCAKVESCAEGREKNAKLHNDEDSV